MERADQPFRTDEGWAALITYLIVTISALGVFIVALINGIDLAEEELSGTQYPDFDQARHW